jgi:PfaB family protein
MVKTEQVEIPKIAIVGMDTHLGTSNGLDAFERSIYEGTQHFIPVPPQRWQGVEKQENLLKKYSFESGVAPSGAYIKDFELDALRFKIPPEKVEKLNHEKLLMLKVADNALKDAGLTKGTRVAIVIVTAAEVSLSHSQERGELLSEQFPELESIAKDSIYNLIGISQYKCNNEHVLANCISNLWNFAGPSFTLTAEQNSVCKALDLAQKLLAIREVDAVLVGAVELAGEASRVLLRNQIAKVNTGVNTLSFDQNANGWIVGEGAGAVVLKLHETAKRKNDRIYAVIDSISLLEENTSKKQDGCLPLSDSEAITQVSQQAFELAGIKAKDIGYLEVFGSGTIQQDDSEIKGLLQAYQTYEPNLSCAIGSVKANIGHTYAVSGMVSLVKTALCLYYRYIPAVPQWSSPKSLDFLGSIWHLSPFYVATESKPWFLEKGAIRRIAAINSIEIDGNYAHLILSEEPNQKKHISRYLEQTPFYLFAIAADDRSSLLDQIYALQQNIEDCSSLSACATQTFEAFQKRQNSTYALSILGRNKDELKREIQYSLKGIADAFNLKKDWQTPAGSYFTAKPLGRQGKIAFVYPGAFNSYIGIGRNLFRLFPQIYDDLVIRSVYSRVANIEKILYPRSLNKFSKRQLETLEQQLIDDTIAMLESEAGFAGLFTTILKDYFKIQPQCAFGYSLGETSMMIAQGIWTSFCEGSDSLNSSELFKTRLSGPKNAVREYWGLPQTLEDASEEFWSNHLVMATPSQVRECLKHENRVYLPLINTPEEVVIAGDTKACLRVIETLNCDALKIPGEHVIHCEPMHSEYDELVRLNTLPLQNVTNTVFYSAAEYQPIQIRNSHTIGHNIAKTLCQQVDFPRLVNRVYEDGTRIFIEVGAGSNCSRWIDKTLKPKEHVVASINKRSVDDRTSIVRLLAKLLSHRVEMDLSPLYSQVPEGFSQSQSRVKNITLGRCEINSTSLTEKILKDTSSNSRL